MACHKDFIEANNVETIIIIIEHKSRKIERFKLVELLKHSKLNSKVQLPSPKIIATRVDCIVLTSVDRDDLPDGGSGHFAQTVKAMKKLKPEIMIECLTSNFRGDLKAVDTLVHSGLDLFAHNIETVKRLQRIILSVLKHAKLNNGGMITKTSIMLGLRETNDELKEAMDDLRAIEVDILTLGQYLQDLNSSLFFIFYFVYILQPTSLQLTVKEYVTPENFAFWKEDGESIGFCYVASGPLVSIPFLSI
ncbi:Lipoyl synthase 1 chloroplastic [Bienertia sinuspersici]